MVRFVAVREKDTQAWFLLNYVQKLLNIGYLGKKQSKYEEIGKQGKI